MNETSFSCVHENIRMYVVQLQLHQAEKLNSRMSCHDKVKYLPEWAQLSLINAPCRG